MNVLLAELPDSDALGILYKKELAAALKATRRSDSEALHDFRVALRRLRVLVKAFAQPGSASKKILRRSARLQKASNRGRDAQVMLAWLAAQWPHLDAQALNGATTWRRALEQEQQHARFRPKQSAAVLQSLMLPLTSLRSREGPLVQLAAQRLEEQLALLCALMNNKEAGVQFHPLRLRVKKIRYLLLPFCAAESRCEQAEGQLHHVQDQLGEWHDAVLRQQSLTALLREEMMTLAAGMAHAVKARGAMSPLELAPALPGLLALARRNFALQQRLERRITRLYLHDGAQPLVQALQGAARELRAHRK